MNKYKGEKQIHLEQLIIKHIYNQIPQDHRWGLWTALVAEKTLSLRPFHVQGALLENCISLNSGLTNGILLCYNARAGTVKKG